LKTLVVGGTGFLGGAVAADAVAAGHDVATFTRGSASNHDTSPITRLTGNRYTDLSAIHGRSFDLVVDTCAFTPRAVNLLLDALSPDIGCYALVSSASVYADCSKPGLDESAPTPHATDDQIRLADAIPVDQRSSAMSYEDYGPLKRSAELVAVERLGARAFVLRSGLLVGPGDYTDRLTYWVRRVDQGGPIVAPGRPARLVQLIDVQDAARFIVGGAERKLGGVFNLTGLPFTMASLLEACRSIAGLNPVFHWIDDEFLLAAGAAPWSELPLWTPEQETASRHFLEISTVKAVRNGLETRPLQESLASIMDWDRKRRHLPLKAGLSADKEHLLLSRYHSAA
jgi:2'-hydroxyisoflavone reductase